MYKIRETFKAILMIAPAIFILIGLPALVQGKEQTFNEWKSFFRQNAMESICIHLPHVMQGLNRNDSTLLLQCADFYLNALGAAPGQLDPVKPEVLIQKLLQQFPYLISEDVQKKLVREQRDLLESDAVEFVEESDPRYENLTDEGTLRSGNLVAKEGESGNKYNEANLKKDDYFPFIEIEIENENENKTDMGNLSKSNMPKMVSADKGIEEIEEEDSQGEGSSPGEGSGLSSAFAAHTSTGHISGTTGKGNGRNGPIQAAKASNSSRTSRPEGANPSVKNLNENKLAGRESKKNSPAPSPSNRRNTPRASMGRSYGGDFLSFSPSRKKGECSVDAIRAQNAPANYTSFGMDSSIDPNGCIDRGEVDISPVSLALELRHHRINFQEKAIIAHMKQGEITLTAPDPNDDVDDDNDDKFFYVKYPKSEIEGIFKPFEDFQSRKKGYSELAAFRLDRLLGLNLMPVTVKRTIDGVEGRVQMFAEAKESRPGIYVQKSADLAFFDYLLQICGRSHKGIMVDDYGKEVAIYNDHALDPVHCNQVMNSKAHLHNEGLPAVPPPTLPSPQILSKLSQLGDCQIKETLFDLNLPEEVVNGIIERKNTILKLAEKRATRR